MKSTKAYLLGFQDGLAGKEQFRPAPADYLEGYAAGQRERGR